MGLNFTPRFIARGAHAALINQRLISWERIDAAGRQSDQLTLKIDTQGMPGRPREGESIGVSEGYAESPALTDKGMFKITRVTPRIFPDSVTIVATAAPFQVKDETQFKLRRSRSFSKMKLGDIFRQVVKAHGFSPRVAPDLDALLVEHIDQTDETDMGFLTRLAKRYDAVTKPVDQLYIMARRGQLKSISGQTLEPVKFSLPRNNVPTSTSFINAEVDFPSRTTFKGVVAKYWDADAGKEVEVTLGDAPFKKLADQFESEIHARESADSELRKVVRTGVTLKMEVPGDPRLVAEGLIELDSSFPDYMRGRWSLDKVTAKGDRGNGYRCWLEATEPL